MESILRLSQATDVGRVACKVINVQTRRYKMLTTNKRQEKGSKCSAYQNLPHTYSSTWQGCEETRDGRQWLQNVNINIVIMDNM